MIVSKNMLKRGISWKPEAVRFTFFQNVINGQLLNEILSTQNDIENKKIIKFLKQSNKLRGIYFWFNSFLFQRNALFYKKNGCFQFT